jgi:hypothetical protein
MSQRRLDGVRDETPKPEKPTPTCDDCGLTSDEAYKGGAKVWPDGKPLREYSDGGYGCHPCSNGERELQTGGPVNRADHWERMKKLDEQGFIADKVFPKVPLADRVFPPFDVEPQDNATFRYVPPEPGVPAHSEYVPECKHTLTGRIQCAKPNLSQMPSRSCDIDHDLTRISVHFAELANGGPLPNYDEEDYDGEADE